MSDYKVGYFVGSLAKGSINRKLAKALVRLAPSGLQMQEIPFRDLPLYSYDYDADYPAVARDFKAAIAGVDAVLFVTPEYNRSIPGGLKNAIDWASRPWGQNSFTRKPSGIIGTSPGAIGTAVGQQHLKSILSFCNSPMMNAIEAYIQFTPDLISDDGKVSVEFDRDVPAQLHDRVQQFHRAGADRLSARVLTGRGQFRRSSAAAGHRAAAPRLSALFFIPARAAGGSSVSG